MFESLVIHNVISWKFPVLISVSLVLVYYLYYYYHIYQGINIHQRINNYTVIIVIVSNSFTLVLYRDLQTIQIREIYILIIIDKNAILLAVWVGKQLETKHLWSQGNFRKSHRTHRITDISHCSLRYPTNRIITYQNYLILSFMSPPHMVTRWCINFLVFEKINIILN